MDPETGDIMISPKEAEKELFTSLLAEFRARVDRYNPTVNTLVQIAGEAGEEKLNFTKAFKKFIDEQAETYRQARKREMDIGTVASRPPPDREI